MSLIFSFLTHRNPIKGLQIVQSICFSSCKMVMSGFLVTKPIPGKTSSNYIFLESTPKQSYDDSCSRGERQWDY